MSRKEKLEKLRQRLSEKQKTLLKKRLRGSDQAVMAPDMIPPRSQSGPVPLSFSQQRMWVLNQFEPNSPAYNEPEAIRLSGLLDVEALKRTLSEMVSRHEILRTEFIVVDGQPMQTVKPAMDWHLELVDLSDLPATEQNVQVAQLATDAARRPFDLSQEVPWRSTLIHLSPEEHVFLLTMHHIVSDGWSMGVFVKELTTLYSAFSVGDSSLLPELPIQYADFASWQHNYLQGETRQKLVTYWQNALRNLPTLAMPTDHHRPIQQTFNGARQTFMLSSNLIAGLQQLSRQEGVSLFMALLAAFQTLLYRYTGQEDIVVGSPIANRNRPELEGLIGFFVNTLVLRTDLSGQPTFRDLLQRVREVTLSAYAHQDLPFELIVKELRRPRDLSRNPLFQIMFILQNAPISTLKLPHLTLSPLSIEDRTAKFDLSLWLEEKSEGLQGTIEYNTDLFEDTTIHRLVGHFQTLLMGIVANPDQPVSHLPLLTDGEKQQLLVQWNDTDQDLSTACQGIHQLFEQHAAGELTRDQVAVVAGSEQLTYRQLNARANQLAHYLITLGVGPDVLVGICVERSLEMIIGLLGILKAGGAYVPLDPSYPNKRLQFMLEDAKVKVLLTTSELLTVEHDAFTIYLDRPLPINKVTNPNHKHVETQLAYVLYTSGSTGRPKGVSVTHRNLIHSTISRFIYYREPVEAFLLIPSFAFDSSVAVIYWTLCSGAKLVIPKRDTIYDLDHLAELIASHRISHWLSVPSFYAQFLISANQSKLNSLRAVIVAGESCPQSLIADHYRILPESTLFNEYGPTEYTVWATVHRFPKEDGSSTVSIGRPISNTQVYILDQFNNPVPLGVPGELYIGGAGVTQGYLNRPELTAERFIPNPFGWGENKLYKTGDLCRYLPNGDIEFLGRIDYQVKIRGYRIELGSIEAALHQCVGVRKAVVVAHEEGMVKRLVGYVTLDDEMTSGDEVAVERALKEQLEKKLPDYMVPHRLVRLEAMPLTPNGKIDRRALPSFDEIRQTQRSNPDIERARTATEVTLVTIWQEVLGLKEVGVRDNFFEIGGDSIISMQIVSRAKEAGIQLTAKELFQHQTIAKLASVARTATKSNTEQGIVTGTLPLTPIQHWFLEQKWRDPHHYNQSVLLELTSQVNPRWLLQALQALLTHHDALRLRFEHQAHNWQQMMVAPEPDLPFEVINLQKENITILEKANELQSSLNLSEGPLLRVALFQGVVANRLLIIIHHLVVDGVSWRILLEDLEKAYQQLASGEPIRLPAKTTSFKRWATLLNEKGPHALQAEHAYWSQRAVNDCSLPIDYELGPNGNASVANISTKLDSTYTQALLNEVPAVYQTQINDLLLAALLIVWNEWTGKKTLLLELEGHGREELFQADLSRTVGWFTAVFPVHLDLMTSDLGETIKSVKEQLRQIPKRGIGYGILRYLSDRRLPEMKAQIGFNYLGQFNQVANGSLIKGLSPESSGTLHSPSGLRTLLLSIDCMIVEGELQVDWHYSQNYHRAQTMQELADDFIDTLQVLIEHCQEPEAGGFTPSDFSRVSLSQNELDDLLAQFGE